MSRYLAVLVGCFALLPAVAAAATAAGRWEGTLKTLNSEIAFVFNLHRDGNEWAGEMDIPAQGASEIPLKNVKVEGAAVNFTIPAPGDPHYEGKLSEDGKTMAGNFAQGGESLPLELKWKSEPRVVSKSAANTGAVGPLEGIWEGILEANGQQLHLRFTFTKNTDGSLRGTLDSVDQGASGIPIASIARTGDSVKLEVKAIGGYYEGTLSKDASSITGTWHQGAGSLPLTVERKPAGTKG
jgi:hypothetical protein